MPFTSATLRQMKTHIKSETSLCGSFQNSVGALSVWVKPLLHKRAQPRSQSSSAISDVTSPVKHVKPPLGPPLVTRIVYEAEKGPLLAGWHS